MSTRQIFSFDVFDTVLTRRVGAPHAVIRLVADAVADHQHPVARDAVVAARTRAERNLTVTRARPARLDEIYHEVTNLLSLPRDLVDWLMANELRIERHLSVPVPGIAAVLESARAASDRGRLIFVSDTPHPEHFITELLAAAGLLRPGDRVYASAERGVSKSGGGLMTLVTKDMNDPGLTFFHVGDNRRSDVAAARAEGWQATHRPHARLTRYEQILEQHGDESAGLASWLAGSSRLARLEMVDRGTSSALAAVAAGVTAPLLLGFAVWVAAQARERRLRRLYFVARDGEMILRAARPVLAVLAPDIECRYLYGSRQAWVLASIASSPDDLADWVRVKQDFTLRTALARVALSPDDVWQQIRAPFAHPSRADEPLGEEDRRLLADFLQRAPLVDLVRRSAHEHAQETIAYLRQEGLAENVPSALVDVGWNGFTARAFDHLVRAAGGTTVAHLFIGVFAAARTARAADDPPDMTGWLFDHDLGRSHVEPVPGPNVAIEMFCAGTHGRVQRYGWADGRVVPQLSTAVNEPVIEWGLPQLRETVDLVARHVVTSIGEEHLHVDLSAPAWRALSAFWTKPTADEVAVWGTFPWEEETWPPYYPVAQSLTVLDAVRRLLRGDRRIRRHNSWRAGSARSSGHPWRALLRARSWHDEHGARLRRLPRWIRLRLAALRSD